MVLEFGVTPLLLCLPKYVPRAAGKTKDSYNRLAVGNTASEAIAEARPARSEQHTCTCAGPLDSPESTEEQR